MDDVPQILERVGVDYVVQNMPAMHRDHRCLSTGSAQLLYIKEASSGHIHYGLHLYRLRNSKKSDEQNQQLARLRSAERAESRLSDRTTTSAASSTLDRSISSVSKHNKTDASDLLGNESTTSSRTLDRSSHRSCSASETPGDHHHYHHHHQLLHHNGAVWLGICGRGIDIYEVKNSFFLFLLFEF